MTARAILAVLLARATALHLNVFGKETTSNACAGSTKNLAGYRLASPNMALAVAKSAQCDIDNEIHDVGY